MFKRWWFGIERSLLFHSIRLFRIRGQSERVARGFALGLIVNLFPTFGFGVLLSGFVARALGGNVVAGFVGGATLTFFWPVLFYLNIRVGTFFVAPIIPVDDLSDVTEKSTSALVWGQTFLWGAIVNSVIVGGLVYGIMRLVYARVRPHALAFFRGHAREHQRRFRRPRQQR